MQALRTGGGCLCGALGVLMKDETQERYVFWRIAHADFQECKATLELISGITENQIKLALVKSAIIAYSRPYSGNDSVNIKRKWKVDSTLVSDTQTHEKVQEFRNNLIAHSSLKHKEPRLGKIGDIYPISFKGFCFEDYMKLVEPLKNLCNDMITVMSKKIDLYAKDHLDPLRTA